MTEHSSEEGSGGLKEMLAVVRDDRDRYRARVEELLATEAVLRGEIRRTVSALATFDDVVAERDDLRGRLAAVEALADEAKARKAAFPDHPHWSAWDHYESDLRDILRAALTNPSAAQGEGET